MTETSRRSTCSARPLPLLLRRGGLLSRRAVQTSGLRSTPQGCVGHCSAASAAPSHSRRAPIWRCGVSATSAISRLTSDAPTSACGAAAPIGGVAAPPPPRRKNSLHRQRRLSGSLQSVLFCIGCFCTRRVADRSVRRICVASVLVPRRFSVRLMKSRRGRRGSERRR